MFRSKLKNSWCIILTAYCITFKKSKKVSWFLISLYPKVLLKPMNLIFWVLFSYRKDISLLNWDVTLDNNDCLWIVLTLFAYVLLKPSSDSYFWINTSSCIISVLFSLSKASVCLEIIKIWFLIKSASPNFFLYSSRAELIFFNPSWEKIFNWSWEQHWIKIWTSLET